MLVSIISFVNIFTFYVYPQLFVIIIKKKKKEDFIRSSVHSTLALHYVLLQIQYFYIYEIKKKSGRQHVMFAQRIISE